MNLKAKRKHIPPYATKQIIQFPSVRIYCPNPACLKNYTTIRQMTSHLTKSIQCFQDITKDLYCQQTKTTGKTRNTNETSLDPNSMVECSTNPIVNMDFLDDNVEIESNE